MKWKSWLLESRIRNSSSKRSGKTNDSGLFNLTTQGGDSIEAFSSRAWSFPIFLTQHGDPRRPLGGFRYGNCQCERDTCDQIAHCLRSFCPKDRISGLEMKLRLIKIVLSEFSAAEIADLPVRMHEVSGEFWQCEWPTAVANDCESFDPLVICMMFPLCIKFFKFSCAPATCFRRVCSPYSSLVHKPCPASSASRTLVSRASILARSWSDSNERSANSAIHCTCSPSTRRRRGLTVKLATV